MQSDSRPDVGANGNRKQKIIYAIIQTKIKHEKCILELNCQIIRALN